jgi:CRP/FNR family transcriptional regulator, cyclic AMP receptor protein
MLADLMLRTAAHLPAGALPNPSRQATAGIKAKVALPDVIRGAAVFTALDDEAITTLRASMSEVNLGGGAVLYREGEPGSHLYVIAEGKVKLARTTGRARENLLAVLAPGEMFGELSAFDPGPRTFNATALTDTRLLALNHADLEAWLQQRPQVTICLLEQLARRLRRAQHAVTDLAFCDVPTRVAKALLDLSRRFGVATTDGVQVGHGLTQLEFAGLVGTSRETLNKVLSDFAERGWLRLQPRALVVLDMDALQHRAH